MIDEASLNSHGPEHHVVHLKRKVLQPERGHAERVHLVRCNACRTNRLGGQYTCILLLPQRQTGSQLTRIRSPALTTGPASSSS